jgi:hypothetical protein
MEYCVRAGHVSLTSAILYIAVPYLFGTSVHLQTTYLNIIFFIHIAAYTACMLYVPSIRTSMNLCIASAWASSILYLLDWKQPWQVFPTPNLIGFYAGIFLEVSIKAIQKR